jgi:uncharacterized protein YggE
MTKKNNAVTITLIIVAGFVILGLLGYSLVNSMNPYKEDAVTVSGQSSIEVTPDLITVYFNIEEVADTSKEAEDVVSEKVNRLVNNIIAEGFSRDEIKTQNFNIYPEYEWKDGEREEAGYRATHSLKVEFSAEETSKIGDVIDAGTESEAMISYINFELSEELQQEKKAEAIKLAAQDAKVKAEAMADGFGLRVGKLQSVSMSEFGYQPWNLYRARGGMAVMEVAEDAKMQTASITPADKDVSAYVTAVYKLK